jgi:hypothetical protein
MSFWFVVQNVSLDGTAPNAQISIDETPAILQRCNVATLYSHRRLPPEYQRFLRLVGGADSQKLLMPT